MNALADLFADQRIRAIEATALLRRVVEEIEVPLFTFDPDQVLRLVNSAGERLLQQPAVRLLGRTAKEIGLAACMTAESETVVPLTFPGSERALAGAPQRVSSEGCAAHADRSVGSEPRAA